MTNENSFLLNVTSSAINKLRDLLIDEANSNLHVRISIIGGGCSGFQYNFSFDDEINEDDVVQEYTDFKILIDALSMAYLRGADSC